MTTKETLTLTRAAYQPLAFLNHQSWTSHLSKITAICREEERSHRGCMSGFRDAHTPDTASVNDCAKLYVVKRIAEYLNGEKFPTGKDYLHYQTSCFYAAGLVDEFGDDIRKAWIDFDIAQLATLDYTDLVKVRQLKAA